MNFSAIRTAVFDLLGDVEASPNLYTKAEIGRYINDAYRHIVRETRSLEFSFFVDTVGGQSAYNLIPEVGRILRVAYDNLRIMPATVHELDRYDTTWRNRTGTPFAYRINQLNDQIDLYPTPDTSSGTLFEGELGTAVDFGADDTFTDTDGNPNIEAGVVVDVDQAGVTHIFVDEDGDPLDLFDISAENGLVVRMPGYTLSGEVGITTRISGGDDEYVFGVDVGGSTAEFGIPVQIAQGEYGVIIDYNDAVNNIEIWASKDPNDLVQDSDTPETPAWTHQAIIFAAASRALLKESEVKNPAASQAYAEMAGIYTDHLKRVVADRMPNKIKHMGHVERRPINRRHPRLPGEYPAVF